MKKIIAFFAFTLIAVSALAGNNKPVPVIAENAKLISRQITVHTDEKGNIIATSRFISDIQLPVVVMKKLMKNYPDQDINYIREFDADGIITYVVALESATGYKLVKVSGRSLKTLETLRKTL